MRDANPFKYNPFKYKPFKYGSGFKNVSSFQELNGISALAPNSIRSIIAKNLSAKNLSAKNLLVNSLKMNYLASNTFALIFGVGLLALLSQVSVPFPGSPVPITGQTLGVLLIGSTYGISASLFTYLTYLVLGFAGAPFFAGGSSGLAHLVGPTGGYLVGMFLATLALSKLQKIGWGKKWLTNIYSFLIAEVLIFAFGVTWLNLDSGKGLVWALHYGLYPFLIGEFFKIAIASQTIGYIWKKIK